MIVELTEELRFIEKEEARLARQKEKLHAKIQENKEGEKKLEELFAKSGYSTPRALIKALMVKYEVRITGSAAQGKRRKRTTVTPELRDAIKQDLQAGTRKSDISRQREISYAVVTKIDQGGYDHLS